MRWERLLAEKRVVEEPTTPEELHELWAVLWRDLKDAAVEEDSTDRRFSIAYDASRGLAKLVVRAEGYRVKGAGGEHYNTFLGLEAALGSQVSTLCEYFNACRKKRNKITYDTLGDTSESEVERLLTEAQGLARTVEEWLMVNHPEILRSL